MVKVSMNISNAALKSLNSDPLKADHVRFVFRDGLNEMADSARQNHRFKTRTGRLEQNTYGKLTKDYPLQGEVAIQKDVRYGFHIHEGTGPRYIKPVNVKALRWASGGKFIFSKGHRLINGIKPDPFVKNAVIGGLPKFEKQLTNAIYKEMN
jgi:hypothetical protein